MRVIDLSCDGAEAFVQQQKHCAILYFTPQDDCIAVVHARLSEVAESFDEHVRFGKVDLGTSENAEVWREGIIVLTPTIICYRFGKPVGEVVSAKDILHRLTRESIVRAYGLVR